MTKITSVCVLNGNYGTMEVKLSDNSSLSITLNETEARQIHVAAERIFETRQAQLTVEVAKPITALPSPDAVDGEFTEVDDEMPS